MQPNQSKTRSMKRRCPPRRNRRNTSSQRLGRPTRPAALAGAVLAIVLLAVSAVAYAQGVPSGLGAIEDKARQIEVLFTGLAAVIVAIGAIWCGVKFVKGDPDAWSYVWKFGLGAVLVFAAPDIVSWLSGGSA